MEMESRLKQPTGQKKHENIKPAADDGEKQA